MRTPHFAPIVLAALLAAGCGSGGGDRRGPAGDSASPSPTADAARPDTSRSGPAFLAVWRDGPLDELRVVRATDGRLVVAGLCAFPDGTKLRIALLSRSPDGATHAAAIVGARVESGRFMSAPLSAGDAPPPPGIHLLEVSALFGPGDQDPAVLAASADGRRFRGPGIRTLSDGRITWSTTLEAPL